MRYPPDYSAQAVLLMSLSLIGFAMTLLILTTRVNHYREFNRALAFTRNSAAVVALVIAIVECRCIGLLEADFCDPITLSYLQQTDWRVWVLLFCIFATLAFAEAIRSATRYDEASDWTTKSRTFLNENRAVAILLITPVVSWFSDDAIDVATGGIQLFELQWEWDKFGEWLFNERLLAGESNEFLLAIACTSLFLLLNRPTHQVGGLDLPDLAASILPAIVLTTLPTFFCFWAVYFGATVFLT